MNRSSREILTAISTAVAAAVETPIEDLPPLSESINPDGLVDIVTVNSSHDVTVTFAYAGQRVLVHSDNTVYVRPIRGTRHGYDDTVSTVE